MGARSIVWTSLVRARTETMARWIDYANGRRAYFDRFLVAQGRLRTDLPEHWMNVPGGPAHHWVDPDSPEWGGVRRAVWLHPLRESES